MLTLALVLTIYLSDARQGLLSLAIGLGLFISLKVFKNNSGKQNNKLYWQNLDDGDTVYSIEIDSGNYNATDLKAILEARESSKLKIELKKKRLYS